TSPEHSKGSVIGLLFRHGDGQAIELRREDDLTAQAAALILARRKLEQHLLHFRRGAHLLDPFRRDMDVTGRTDRPSPALGQDARNAGLASRFHQRHALTSLNALSGAVRLNEMHVYHIMLRNHAAGKAASRIPMRCCAWMKSRGRLKAST